MKKIYMIRHGETQWNTEGRFQGKTDTPLSERGIEQARLLAERTKGIKLDIVYSSPLRRAADTAAPLAELRGLPVILRDELKEIDFGHWEGLTFGEIETTFPEEFKKCRSDPFTHGFRYGMPFDDVKRTASAFINECVHSGDCERIAVVSHSAVLKMVLTVLLELPPNFIHSLYIENCSVSVIGIDSNKTLVYKLNDTGEIK